MMKIGKSEDAIQEPNSKIQYFSIKKRHAWDDGMCKGCGALACPMGLPGPPGDPGLDGTPGESGRPGQAGEDGFDIQIEVTEELPCVICPGGPPGLRGNQGERGMTGQPGRPGGIGSPGIHGIEGPMGDFGPNGPPGVKGPEGSVGPKGSFLFHIIFVNLFFKAILHSPVWDSKVPKGQQVLRDLRGRQEFQANDLAKWVSF